jgi:hypothetical protein
MVHASIGLAGFHPALFGSTTIDRRALIALIAQEVNLNEFVSIRKRQGSL